VQLELADLSKSYSAYLRARPKEKGGTINAKMSSSVVSKRLEGKTILITGASSGIGRSTALELARSCPKNLRLILVARRIGALYELTSQINKEVGDGVKIFIYQLDVSKSDEADSFVSSLQEGFQEIDILVNSA
jgi:3-hydroxy acid dehydrogenase / malonic semialdehyde reductase